MEGGQEAREEVKMGMGVGSPPLPLLSLLCIQGPQAVGLK